MATGAVISAPAVFLSVVLGVSVTNLCLLMALPTAVYTMFGGVQAVAWTDVKQMGIIVGGLLAAVVALVVGLPDGVGLGDALSLAGTVGRLQVFDFRFDLTDRYTFWSGTIAAFFLFCSYFGTDQSQVQRYLTAKSVDEARTSLLMSAYWKIPLQALVLLVGVLVFVFFVFTPPPMLFNPRLRRRGAVQRAGRRLRGRGDEVPGRRSTRSARRRPRSSAAGRPAPRPRPRPPPSQPPAPTSRPRAPRPSRW